MKTRSRRIVIAALIAALAAGGTGAFAGEGGQHSAQRAKLKAEWAEARARNAAGSAANPDASFVARLFGVGGKETEIAAAPAKQPKKN